MYDVFLESSYRLPFFFASRKRSTFTATHVYSYTHYWYELADRFYLRIDGFVVLRRYLKIRDITEIASCVVVDFADIFRKIAGFMHKKRILGTTNQALTNMELAVYDRLITIKSAC